MKALWWREGLPNTDTPKWFRENCLVIRKLTVDDIELHRPMRDYFGMPYAIHYSSSYAFNHYSPLYRLNPMDIAYAETVHGLGLHLYPYTDPRLWAHQDRRDEDFLYSTQWRRNTVIRDGREYTERYGDVLCSIVCPSAPAVQELTHATLKLITDQGFDGIYCDQIGAALPLLCESVSHGHAPRDPDAYYRDGWRRIFTRLRAAWKRQGAEKILVTEDNAEHCVGIMDGMLPWRWMYDNQVPLYPMVYAGRTQFTGREPDCEEPDAIFVKAASMLVNSEQIGWLESGLVVSPLRHDYRVFLRQLLWLRKALLPFFNEGAMARPPRFARAWGTRTMRWGVRGTGRVSSPDVVSSAWHDGDDVAIVLVNHTSSVQANTLRYSLPAAQNTVRLFHSDHAAVELCPCGQELSLDFTLAPRSSLLVLAQPDGTPEDTLARNAEAAFAEIRKSPAVPDPFVVEPRSMASADAGAAVVPHQAADLPAAIGGRINREKNQLDYIRDAFVSAGEVDFGNGGLPVLKASFAAPPGCGSGCVEFFIDDIRPENRFASFGFDGSFSTRDWNTYEFRTAPLERKVTGRHRVFIQLRGASFCNFRCWHLSQGDAKP
jgi:hypothetical protein